MAGGSGCQPAALVPVLGSELVPAVLHAVEHRRDVRVADDSDEPVDHPDVAAMFDRGEDGRYQLRGEHRH